MGRKIYDWAEVQRFVDGGHGFVDAQKHFGFSHTAWIKAIKREALRAADRPFTDRRRRYDWAAVQAYYDEGHLYEECLSRFGFTANAWTGAVRRGELRARARALPIDHMIASKMARGSIKRRLLELGILTPICSRCGLNEWRGKPLTIHLDHIDGNKHNSRIDNLRMLCPNCHSQTPTFAGRNVRRTRAQEEGQHEVSL
jgi:5-methylcytosine-specific restriction endonuclease McrA